MTRSLVSDDYHVKLTAATGSDGRNNNVVLLRAKRAPIQQEASFLFGCIKNVSARVPNQGINEETLTGQWLQKSVRSLFGRHFWVNLI